MQDFIGSVCRSLVFKPSDAGGVFGGFVEKIGSTIRKSGIGLFSKPPVPALPPIAKSDAINVKKDDAPTIRWRKGELIGCGAFGRVYMGLNIDSGALLAIKQVSIAANTASKEKTQPQRIEPSMAVEAGHLNLFPPQLITNRNLLNSNAGNAGTYNTQMGFGMPFTGTLQEFLLPFPQSLVCDSIPVKTSVKAKSGVTYNVPVAPRKRSRDSFNQINNFTVPQENNNNNNLSELSSLLVAEHTNKIRVELEEKQKQHARLLLLAIGVGVMKKMKEKDEQIQRMGKLNWVLQERVKSLYVENQWRDLAQTNEAAANSSNEEYGDDSDEQECHEEDEEVDVMALRKLVRIERQRANAAYLELEKERLAEATAADEAMAMILKLQTEKSWIEMEANQYRRLTEEKQLHNQGVIHSLRWIVMKHELERGLLEDQLRFFRQKLKLSMREQKN